MGEGARQGRAQAVRPYALVQRCKVHKRRNVIDHLSELERGSVDARLARAFANPKS
jgi:transposase-like protein